MSTTVLPENVTRDEQLTTELAPAGASPAPAASTDTGRTFAITSFVLGVVSVVSGWTFVAPIIGLVLGILALRRKTGERTLALWGVWLSGAMLALTLIVAFFAALFVGVSVLTIPFIEG